MSASRRPLFLWIFLVILAPIASVVSVTALLLFGVEPQMVFAPGRAVKSVLEGWGFHPANRVAVASTVVCFWTVIAGCGLLWDRRAR